MRVVKARLWDVPTLAWVAARAFAAENSRKGVRRRAVVSYPMHLISVLAVYVGGQLWHGDRRALIGIGRPGCWRSYLTATVAVSLSAAAFLAFLWWIPTASMDQLRALMVGMALLLVVLVVVMVPAVREFHPLRSLANGDAINHWKKSLPGCVFYKVSYLAMYPQSGEGFTFARTAINQVVPHHAGIYVEARTAKHQLIYTRAGLHPLPTRTGIPTLAMGTLTT